MSVPINKIMTQTPHTIGHDIAVSKAKAMMKDYNCHHLPVLDGGNLVGIISDRDINLIENLPQGENTLVEDLMTDGPFIVDPEMTVIKVVKDMLDKNINSAIVTAKDGEPWGIFTTTDALSFFIQNS